MGSLCSEESGKFGWDREFEMAPTRRIVVDDPCKKIEVRFSDYPDRLEGLDENVDRKRKLAGSRKPISNQSTTVVIEGEF